MSSLQRAIKVAPPLAMAALLMLIMWPSLQGFRGSVSSGKIIDGLLETRSLEPSLIENLLTTVWSTSRTDDSYESLSDEQIEFRLGRRAVDLQILARAESLEDRRTILREILQLLRASDTFAVVLESQFQSFLENPDVDQEGPLTGPSLVATSHLEVDLEEHLDSDHFRLGRWAETGRLATMIRDDEFFADLNFRRPAIQLLRAELSPKVTEQIQHIVTITDEPVEVDSLQTLREAFETIIAEAG